MNLLIALTFLTAIQLGHLSEAETCTVQTAKKDCGYLGIQEEECLQRHCCWKPDEVGPCWRQQPGDATYIIADRHDQGTSSLLTLQLAAAVLPELGPDFNTLKVLVEPQTAQRLHVKIAPPGHDGPTATATASSSSSSSTGESGGSARWEVPSWLIPRPPSEGCDPAARLYSVQLPQQGQPFSLTVSQHAAAAAAPPQQTPSRPVFDSANTRLVFKQQYMEISTRLDPSTALYGLGETINPSGSLALPRDGCTITLWNIDVAAFNSGLNLYGSHPFILQVHQDGVSSGIFLLNSNGMDVELQESSLTYRVIGGVLDFYFLLGPSPEAVIQQYHQVIGRPAMPPYWALGFHQCRWGYKTLSDVEEVVAAYSAADIPLEVIWSDIDYMYKYRDFTFDPDRFNAAELRAFADRLHARGQRWVPITDCGIPRAPDDPAYTSGMARGVFLKDVTGQPYLGQVWPGATHYPDFLAVHQTWPWWKEQLQRMWHTVPFDGLWIDMNEASNFCDGEVCRLRATNSSAFSSSLSSGSSQPAVSSKAHLSAEPEGQAVLLPYTLLQGAGTLAALFAKLMRGAWLQQARALLHDTQPPSSNKEQQQQHFLKNPRPSQANCDLDCMQPDSSNKLAFPPYALNNLHNHVPLGSKTLPMTARHVGGQLQYNTHNLYGLSEAAATHWSLVNITGKRPFVLSRSTFPGSGRHAAHWTGDNAATWQDLQWSVQGLVNSNMWGIALAGADICGFQGDTSEELCARWIAAGAFYTFSRNHNTLGAAPQELYRWPTVAAAARNALALRYRLLPYLYSCFYRAHTEGGTVARPLLFEFPGDPAARAVSTQWLLGRSILVAPVLEQGTTEVAVYFPAATWYKLSGHFPQQQQQQQQQHQHQNGAAAGRYLGPSTTTFTVPLTEVPPVFVRGGSIVATQVPHNTTDGVRASPVTLLVALDHGTALDLDEATQQPTTSPPAAVTAEQLRDQTSSQARKLIDAVNVGAAGNGNMLEASLALCAACSRAGSNGVAGGTGSSSTQLPCSAQAAAGLLLGCGMLYWDDGDSLLEQVSPPTEEEEEGAGGGGGSGSSSSVTVLFSSMVQRSTRMGWIMMAAEGTEEGYAAAAGSGPDLSMPAVEEVQVLGVLLPAAGEGIAVWLDGERLPAAQVEYSALNEVLRVTGLQLQLTGVSRLEWRFVEGAGS